MKSSFSDLFQTGEIGTMSVANRVVMAPMLLNLSDEKGFVTPRMLDYYAARSKGGVGLVVVEASCIEPLSGRTTPFQLGIDDDRLIAGLAELALNIKGAGVKSAVQIQHAGRRACCHDLVGPSAIRHPSHARTPRELTTGEIEVLIEKFGRAAKRAQESGFDGVEIQAGHQYLISQFLSSASNKRQDAYGGDLNGKAKLLLGVIAVCRREVGDAYPLWCRLSAAEFGMEDGITLEETLQVACWAEAAGVDAISVSCHGVGRYPTVHMPHVPASMSYLAEAVKKVISVPVFAVGRLSPAPAARMIRDGKADFAVIGRALLADPEWASKVRRGQVENIRPCIGCWECVSPNTLGQSHRCSVNPALGREKAFILRKAKRPKSVLVIGGGPGGLEAARVAALRGHSVTLYEKTTELGGQLLAADKPPEKNHIHSLRSFLVRQILKNGVKVHLGEEATLVKIQAIHPEAIVVATGCRPILPHIPGIWKKPLVTAVDVLAGKTQVGKRIVVIGAERVGCETADFLASRGIQVVLTRRGDRLATNISPYGSRLLRDRLAAKRVRILTGIRYIEVIEEGLVIQTREGRTETMVCDTIVSAVGASTNDELFQEFRGWADELYLVGDALGPKGIWEALTEGWRAGMAI